MFEKEAEEYVNEEYDFCYYPEDNLSTRINAERDWQKGAEFGYNKAKEEYEARMKVLTQNRDELLTEIERLEERVGELSECY